MLTLVLSYFGGALTILSPCVLPVVPFIFSRSNQSFRRSGLPLLVGMGICFATFAALSVAGGHWVIHANQVGRMLALAVFGVLGLSLVAPSLADRLFAPIARLGATLQNRADATSGVASSIFLGASVGLLWAPCAGPILGLVLAGASLGDSNSKTFVLLLAFAAGAATSLGLAIFVGGKVLTILKKTFGVQEWIRRALGVGVLAAVVSIALGLDTKMLASLSYVNTGAIEQSLVNRFSETNGAAEEDSDILADEGPMPSLDGASSWLNSPPLSAQSLRGKVALIDFWTYSCINCLRTLPYVKAWAEKYRDRGLVVIGVHTPEFAFEKDVANVTKAVRALGLAYPVALDNEQTIWSAFKNRYWPAHYFIDKNGHLRFHHFGEGGYQESERVIQELLGETSSTSLSPIFATGIQAPAGDGEDISPETYLGYARAQGFASVPDIRRDVTERYSAPTVLALNHWSLSGRWKVFAQLAFDESPGGALSFRFRARDLHLVIGATRDAPVRYRVTLDGHSPGMDHGTDTDPSGNGTAHDHRLYQLIRQPDGGREHTFRIEFLDPGAEVYAVTFG